VAEIKGISGMTPAEIAFELNRGGKFVVYRYCYSVIMLTVFESTAVYLIRSKENRIVKGLPWILLTFFLGWWGIPWGPIRTVQSIWINLQGGVNVTARIAAGLHLTELKWDVVGEP
jgi:hypothetical protein